MDALVRRAVPQDGEAIARVHIEGWQAAYRGQLPDRFLNQLSDEFERRSQFWTTHIANPPSLRHEVWVAEVEGQVQGFMALGPARDAASDSIGELYAIYVHPTRWQQGLGRAMLTRATDRLASLRYSTAMLWVLDSNARTRRFYERAGWTAAGRTKTETLPDGVELREVSYQIALRKNEES